MGQRMNCLANYPLTHLSVGLSFSSSVGLSVSLPIYLFVGQFVFLSLSVDQSVCLFVS